MKSIRVSDVTSLEAVFAQTAGRAKAHTATAGDVTLAAERAEAALSGLPKKLRVGARVSFLSGDRITSRSYKGAVLRHRVTLVRKSAGWAVTEVEKIDTFPNVATGLGKIALDQRQYSALLQNLMSGFVVEA